MRVKVFELSFDNPKASNMYVVAKNRQNVIEDMKGAFGPDLDKRVRLLTSEEVSKLGFINYQLASATIRKGEAKTYILSKPRQRK